MANMGRDARSRFSRVERHRSMCSSRSRIVSRLASAREAVQRLLDRIDGPTLTSRLGRRPSPEREHR